MVFSFSALGVFVKTPALASETIQISIDSNYPPYMYEEQGKEKGLYSILLVEIFKRMDMDMDLSPLPWKRAIREIDGKKSGLGGLYVNKERLKKYDFTDPIYWETLVVYAPSSKSFPFNTLKDLKGKTVALNSTWSYGDKIDTARKNNLFNVFEAQTNAQSLRMLAANRIDAAIIDNLSSNIIIQASALTKKVIQLPKPIPINGAYLAFHKGAKRIDLIKKFNQTLSAMKKDSSYRNIINHFIQVSN